jgi:adenylate cyclase
VEHGTKRRLAAILSADIAGYSRLMGEDEVGTHRTLSAYLRVTEALIAAHDGRVVGTAGDGMLAEFPSAVDAVTCAVEIQRQLEQENAGLPPDRCMRFRIGINLGDVIVDGADIFGDGVNVVARLQALAEPGGLCISGSVHEQVRNKLGFSYRPLGSQRVKNIAEPVRAFAVSETPSPSQGTGRRKALGGYRIAIALPSAMTLGIAAVMLWPLAPHRDTPAPGAPASVAVTSPSTIPVAAKLAIAVLPFANLSNDATQDYFSDGLTEDLIAALGRFSGLAVIARSAVSRYKGSVPSQEEVVRALKVTYLVEGSVRKAGDQVRVTAQLTDVTTGVHLWSDRFDGEIKDVFAVQDEITRRIASALAIRVSQFEQDRAFAKPTESLAAYDLLLRGRERLAQRTRVANREARRLFERALAMDPRYAPAHAALGWTYFEEAKSGWTEFLDDAITRAESAARAAIDLDPVNESAYRLLGFARLFRGKNDLAIADLDRAIELNPSDAESHWMRGAVLMWSGRLDRAVEALETASRLGPNLASSAMNLGTTYYLQGRHEEAVRVLEGGLSRDPDPLMRSYSYVALAAAYGQLGRAEDAARAKAALAKLQPFFKVDSFLGQFKTAADRSYLAEGLRKAGLE